MSRCSLSCCCASPGGSRSTTGGGTAAKPPIPLYRGFDPEDKERTEEYDQPVLVRLNTRDQAELREGFPKTREDLFEYSAVVFDDIEAEFFTHEQMDLVRRFVAERGGGFLMLGGKDSFQTRPLRPHPGRRHSAGLPGPDACQLMPRRRHAWS